MTPNSAAHADARDTPCFNSCHRARGGGRGRWA